MKKAVLSKDKWHESGSYTGTAYDGEVIATGYVIEKADSGQYGWSVEIEYWGRRYLGPYTKLRTETRNTFTLTEARAIARHTALEFYLENN